MSIFVEFDMRDAVEVQFKTPIMEDDFVERGMKAWLTAIEWRDHDQMYELYFYFGEHEAENEKYFRENYHPNIHTARIDPEGRRKAYTAKEAGMYTPRLSCLYSLPGDVKDHKTLSQHMFKYLHVIRKDCPGLT